MSGGGISFILNGVKLMTEAIGSKVKLSGSARPFKRNKFIKKYQGLFYLIPWIIGLLVFQLYPLISSFYYSLTSYNMVSAPVFVGFRNYIMMFTQDTQFWRALGITFRYVLFAVPLRLLFALFIAFILSMKVRGIGFFRTVYYLPSIIGSSVAVSFLWSFLFRPDGVVNTLIKDMGFPGVYFLGDPKYALYTVSLLSVWQFGSTMILFLAALKNIPETLYESSRVDGATMPRMFIKITIPMLSPIIFFNLLMQTFMSLQEFTSVYIMTGGGPARSTYLYPLKIYEEAFKHFKMGYASAMSWVLFVIIAILAVVLFASSSWVYYGDN